MKMTAAIGTRCRNSAAAITVLLGLAVLAGWIFSIPLLKSVLPGAVEMKANTAVGLLLSGSALFVLDNRPSRRQQHLAQALGLAVMALGLSTLGEYLFGWQLGIDELLFRDPTGIYETVDGRMSPYSAVTFAMTGLTLTVLPWRSLGSAGATVIDTGGSHRCDLIPGLCMERR